VNGIINLNNMNMISILDANENHVAIEKARNRERTVENQVVVVNIIRS
jgi:hypothetical protein